MSGIPFVAQVCASTAIVTLTVTAASGSSGNNGGGGGSGGEGGSGGGGGGPLRWYDLLALAALLSWRFVQNSRQAELRGKNLSPAVNNL